jgi:hypothetical protein
MDGVFRRARKAISSSGWTWRAGALGAPARHPLADDIFAALDIVRKARIVQPLVLVTHQPGPANEQWMTK